jgi:hypothetical protein
MLEVTHREMLTLAAITYRGMLLVGSPSYKRRRLRELMDDSMTQFSAVKGKWKIVWGPASFSPESVGLDDALMYVARSITDPSALVIAIRGTNTLSLSDWIFGDLVIEPMVDWHYDDSAKSNGAKISASTALSLSILQHLRWEDSKSGGPALAAATAPAGSPPASSLEAWVEAIIARLSASAPNEALGTILPSLANFTNPDFNPITLLETEGAKSEPQDGKDLRTFLRDHVAAHPGAEIIVTGHSKGGALSTTLALSLADTRGPQTDPAREWNSRGDAPVSAWSFAGPTAGNKQFADHSNRVFDQLCHRIWNSHDIVPYAFVAALLRTFSSQYDDLNSIVKAALDRLLNLVADRIGGLEYQQLGGQVERRVCEVADLAFPAQLGYQHLDAYLKEFGLDNELSFDRLVKPAL